MRIEKKNKLISLHWPLKQSGQVIIEYVLLMLITLALATFLMRTLVSRSQDDTGVLMKKWQSLIEQIASDDPNKRR